MPSRLFRLVPRLLCRYCAGTLLISALTVAYPALSGPACGLYQYKAVVTDVYDGDTITADIDLGFQIWKRGEKLRLYGINTPELKGQTKAAGVRARDALRGRILGKELMICTIDDEQEKFGRYLVKVYVGDELVNDWLVASGYAVPYFP